MRVLVTGGFGFVGQAVVRELTQHGHQVVVLTRHPLPHGPADVPRTYADILDLRALTHIIRGGRFDGVCHLAALTSVRYSHDRPLDYFECNAVGTLNILRALWETPPSLVPRFVLASTGAVYGDHEGAATEGSPTAPTNPYATSKLAAEHLVQYQAARAPLAAATLRCYPVSGAVAGVGDQDMTRIIPRALAVAAGEAPSVEVNGNGSAVRDIVHVGDVAVAYRLALEAAVPGEHRVWNVSTGQGATVSDVLDAVRRVTGRQVPVKRQPPKVEPHVLVGDSSRIRDELGWKPERSSLDVIVRDAWAARQQTITSAQAV